MTHVYVLEHTTTKGFYSNSFIIKKCFSSLHKAMSYVEENYKHAKETENQPNVIKTFDLNPNDNIYAYPQMIEIHEIEVK